MHSCTDITVGKSVDTSVGAAEGLVVGIRVGPTERSISGDKVGDEFRERVGEADGIAIGTDVIGASGGVGGSA